MMTYSCFKAAYLLYLISLSSFDDDVIVDLFSISSLKIVWHQMKRICYLQATFHKVKMYIKLKESEREKIMNLHFLYLR